MERNERQQSRNTRFELEERIKELNCLYGISKLVENYTSLDEIIRGIAMLVPQAWQYPDITRSRIIINDCEYTSDDFRESRWSMSSSVKESESEIGCIEVFYLEKKPECDEGPFLREERDLLDAIAERLGDIIEREKATDNLKRLHRELEIKSINLEETNTALKVLLRVKNSEREDLEKSMLENIKILVLPYLEKIGNETSDKILKNYVSIIEQNLRRITTSFSYHLFSDNVMLSPSEIQVAQLILDNKSSKEISRILNVSEHTVFYYRKNIRKKLDLTDKKINLRSYLQSMQ